MVSPGLASLMARFKELTLLTLITRACDSWLASMKAESITGTNMRALIFSIN